MKCIIFSAPSGSGKSTIISALMNQLPQLAFSVSCTSRAPRGEEQHGREYYFLSTEEFRQKIENKEFIEHEEVYAGCYYGTLRSEVQRLHQEGKVVVFDIDVVGGINLKTLFGQQALSLFIQPPSLDELHQRLVGRGTDAPEVIAKRLAKAELELSFAPQFDNVVVNSHLPTAIEETLHIITNFINQ